ncbi:MAG: hypothetical protein H6644_19290 [Caldilineaceae bacterium]|nr:hypothetical protein [Caldilineaceae bacterium]
MLAIDPTSSITRGSILGDKTRWNPTLAQPTAHPSLSIPTRPSSGVARKVRDHARVRPPASTRSWVEPWARARAKSPYAHGRLLLLVLIPAAAMSCRHPKGVVELADAIAINKADGMTSRFRPHVEYNRAPTT